MAKSEYIGLNYGSSNLKEIREEGKKMKNDSTSKAADKHIPAVAATSTDNNKHTLGKRGRKPAKLDMKMKLERSQQSARECRARKKLRYQYLEELVASREKAIFILRKELEMYKNICKKIDENQPLSRDVVEMITNHATNSNSTD